MPEIKVVVRNKVGLHARPAAMFVKTANQYTSNIQVVNGAKAANAKSILSVLTLGAGQGAEIILRADGEDSEAALQALRELVEDNFGEEG